MAVVTVSANNTRISQMETTSDGGSITSISGGAGAGQEPDFVYQNLFSLSRKIGTTRGGFYLGATATTDVSTGSGTYQTMMFKVIATNSSALLTRTAPALGLRVGSGTDYHETYALGSDNYPIKGGWVIFPFDPNITDAAYRDTTSGTPDLTIADYFGIVSDFNVLAFAANLALDAIDVGNGLLLIGGDGGDPDGTFEDYVTFDEGTQANRFGYVSTLENIIYVFGTLVFGSATATVFTDSSRTLVFPDGKFIAGWSGLDVDLQNATTNISWTACNFLSIGNTTTTDTRAILTVTGTSGEFSATQCVFDNFESLTLTSSSTLTDCTISNCNAITQASATITNCVINGATTADGVAFITSDDPETITNTNFTFSDGHAIELTTTGTYDFTGNVFTGYGADATNDAAVYNNSGGLITLNILGGVSAPSIRNGASASTIINNAVTIKVQGVTESAAVKIIANETVGTITTGDVILETLADSNGEATISFNYEGAFDPSGLDVLTRVRASGLPAAAIQDDNNSFTDETTAANRANTAVMNLLPAVPVVNEDRYLFGHAEKFDKLKLDINTIGTGGFTITWQYWDGTTWTNLSGVVDDTNSFSVGEVNLISFTEPGDWATTTINSQGPYFYIRAAYTAGTVTIVPLGTVCTLDVTKYLPFVQNGIITSTGLTVTASWVKDTIATF